MKDIISYTTAVATFEEAQAMQRASTENTFILHLWQNGEKELYGVISESAVNFMKALFNEDRVLTDQLPSVPETESPAN